MVGGEISYEYQGGNQYTITLKFYRDCGGVELRNPATFLIYNSSDVLVQRISVPLSSQSFLPLVPPGPCTPVPPGVCVEMGVYITTATLPPIPGGYKIVHYDLARNAGIVNGPDGAGSYLATIPDISIAPINSNPKYKNTPPVFICVNSPLSYDNSATDVDGDSLVYSLCSPLERAVPYTPYPFFSPYTATNPLGGGMSINPTTGLLTGTPNMIGRFVVGVCVTEYRKGKLISTSTRDFQFNVVECRSLSVASALSALTNCNTHEVTFFNNSVDGVSYLWDFGDGTTSTAFAPVHIYPATGNYTVTLTAYASDPNCKDVTTFTVKVDVCRPCGMSVSVSSTPAECGVGGCGKITWTVPCTSCANRTVNNCNNFSYSDISNCGNPAKAGIACPAGVICNGVDIALIPGATSTWQPGGPCSCGYTSSSSGSIITIVLCTNKPQTLGTATVSVTGGTPPYTYGWTPSGGNGATATGLSAKIYTVIVTDANGCVEIKSVPIAGDGTITLNTGKTDITGCGLTNGTATVTPANGSGAYTYLWSPGGQTTSSVSGLAAGTYTVLVNDASNCPSTKTVTINPVATISFNATPTDAPCFGAAGGSATVSAPSGGVGPYTYSWNTTPVQTTATATNLPKGFYMVQVTDANGCTGTKAITVNSPNPLTVALAKVSPTCFDSKNGTVTASPSGGTAPYTYLWGANAASQTTSSASALIGGQTYTVTVTDNKGCTKTGSIFNARPSIISHDIVDKSTVTCNGTFTGIAENIASGGTGTLTYSWSPGGATTAIASNLTSGVRYTVVIRDANNCSVDDTITVFNKGPIAIVASATKTCGNSPSGTATVLVNGGTAPFTYQWNPGSLNSPTIVGLESGATYAVTVTDGSGCTKTSSVSIGSNPALTLSETVTGCTNSAAIDLAVSGGSTPYVYTWDNGMNTEDLSGLSPNIYKITVWDANNCFDTLSINIGPTPCTPSVLATGGSACPGACVVLTAVGSDGKPPYTYAWSPGAATGTTANICTGGTQTYTVTITDNLGATSTSTASVIFNADPVVTANPESICENSSTPLTASGADTYTWTPATGLSATTGGTVTANPTATETYTVTGTSSLGCTASTAVTVTVNSNPIITVPNASMCPGNPTTLTASGGATYTWTPATDLSATTGETVTANPPSNATYTVVGTSSAGCSNSTTVTVSVGNIVADAGSNTTICTGKNTTLNATGGTSYVWSPAGSLDNASSSNPLASPTATTTYTVTATSGICTDVDSVTITVNALPVLSSNNDSICEGIAKQLSVSGADTYLWTPSTGLSSSTGNSVSANPTTSTTYTIVGTITSSGCVDSTTVQLNVNPVPVLTSSPDSLCENSSVTLTVSGAAVYTWTPTTGLSATTGASVTANPTASIAYTVVGSTLSGCTATTTVPVKVFPLPVALANSGGPYCEGDVLVLNSAGGTSYSWSGPNSFTSAIQSPTISASTMAMTGTYTVTVSSVGCTTTSTATTTIIVNPAPIPTASNTGSYCPGETIDLTSTGGTSYDWTGPNGFTSVNQNPSIPSSTVADGGVYTVTATAGGCSTAVSTTVIVYPVEKTNVDPHICPGQTYTHTNGTTVSTSTVFVDTLSSVVSGCDSIITTTLTVNTPYADAGSDVTIFSNASTVLTATGGVSYAWTPAYGLSCTACPDPTADPDSTTTYYVVSTDAAGCTSMDSVTVTVKEYIPCNDKADMSTIIPNAFTPNHDGWNDLLCIPENICIKNISLRIYDRWGEKVYDSTNPADCWDGIYRGKELNTAVFAYYLTIEYPSGEKASSKGNISLIK